MLNAASIKPFSFNNIATVVLLMQRVLGSEQTHALAWGYTGLKTDTNVNSPDWFSQYAAGQKHHHHLLVGLSDQHVESKMVGAAVSVILGLISQHV